MNQTIQAKKLNWRVIISSSQANLSWIQGTAASTTAFITTPIKNRVFANKDEFSYYMKKRGATQAQINTAIINFWL